MKAVAKFHRKVRINRKVNGARTIRSFKFGDTKVADAGDVYLTVARQASHNNRRYICMRGFISELASRCYSGAHVKPVSLRSSLCRAGTISSCLNGLNNIRLKLMVSIQGACHASIYLYMRHATRRRAGPTSYTVLMCHSGSLRT